MQLCFVYIHSDSTVDAHLRWNLIARLVTAPLPRAEELQALASQSSHEPIKDTMTRVNSGECCLGFHDWHFFLAIVI